MLQYRRFGVAFGRRLRVCLYVDRRRLGPIEMSVLGASLSGIALAHLLHANGALFTPGLRRDFVISYEATLLGILISPRQRSA